MTHIDNNQDTPSIKTQDRASYASRNDTTQDIIPNINDTQSADSDFSFFDFLDIINPLQHIPVVNIAYRAITHDEIKPIGDIIGGAIFGGAIGAATGIINTISRQETGKDIAGNVLSLFEKNVNSTTSMTSEQSSKELIAYNDLPASLLAYSQTPLPRENQS